MVLVFDSDFPAVRVELEMLFLRRGVDAGTLYGVGSGGVTGHYVDDTGVRRRWWWCVPDGTSWVCRMETAVGSSVWGYGSVYECGEHVAGRSAGLYGTGVPEPQRCLATPKEPGVEPRVVPAYIGDEVFPSSLVSELVRLPGVELVRPYFGGVDVVHVNGTLLRVVLDDELTEDGQMSFIFNVFTSIRSYVLLTSRAIVWSSQECSMRADEMHVGSVFDPKYAADSLYRQWRECVDIVGVSWTDEPTIASLHSC